MVKQRYGAVDDFDLMSIGGGSETYNLAGHEGDPAVTGHN